MIILIVFAFFILRLYSLVISIRHAKQLQLQGATEYGKRNSTWLALTHIAIYVSATIEAWLQQTTMNSLSVIGLILMIFAYIILFMVIKTLGAIWTLKLYILPHHPIIKSGLFKITKHPNYFLNIVPELLGLLLLTQAGFTAPLLLPYAYLLWQRIHQEERLMHI